MDNFTSVSSQNISPSENFLNMSKSGPCFFIKNNENSCYYIYQHVSTSIHLIIPSELDSILIQ